MKDRKHLSLRIDAELLTKFRYVCAYEGRSANGQLLVYIRSAVKAFEEANGEIVPEEREKA